ncbi:endonuclease domain-containing protein [Marivirga sp.]|uniref:endonuclease domain-containing protein n=1 Tax=Marivirga sp. TaxID=2018662 RepID=UPI002D8037A3|nr:DUF559 domain-containing protein [Marivirga sp.]HET8858764.1 DUF559 domain-containing protein [Marivirga sp.]
MKNYQIHNRPELKEYRKRLRNNGTPAEAFLWNYLKAKQLKGRKFRRQFSVGNYILDFYCPAEKLCIELDGADHFTSAGYQNDEERTNYLNHLGIKVIRFENKTVFDATESVLETIVSNFKE